MKLVARFIGNNMSRILQGTFATVLCLCSILSCSEGKATDVTNIALDDPTVEDYRVASALVTLAQSTLEVGQTTQATAVLLDRWHHALDLRVLWRSSDPAVATVTQTGL